MIKEKRVEKGKIAAFAVFAAFFALLMFQLSFVYMYADDFGYASLSAMSASAVSGTDFTLSELIDFLKLHYETWGGRVLWFFIEILLLKSGLFLTRLVEAVAITALFYLFYKISAQKGAFAAAICCSTYGLLSAKLISDGVFWFSASYFYVVPLALAVFAVSVCARLAVGKSVSKPQSICALFAAILGGWSQEHVAAAFLVMLGLTLLMCLYNDRRLSKSAVLILFICAAAAVSAAALVLAPGNFVRNSLVAEFYPQGLLNRALFGMKNLSSSLFSRWNILTLGAILLLGSLLAVRGIKRKRVLSLISLTVFAAAAGILLFGFEGTNDLFTQQKLVKYFVCWAALAAAFAWISAYCAELKRLDILIFLAGAATALGVCCATVVVDARTLVPFSLLLFLPLSFGFLSLTNEASNRKLAAVVLLAVSLTAAAPNVASITAGYKRNAPVNILNDRLLSEASERIKKGEAVDRVTLYMLPNGRCTNMQPYFEGQSVILTWLLEYYDIPTNVAVSYEPTD